MTIYKYNTQVRASARLLALRQDMEESNTIVEISNNAVIRKDMEIVAMAADANKQAGRRMDAFDEAINPESAA